MATTNPELREYPRSDVVSFRKTSEEFGGLSNMAPGYPIHIGGRRILTSEALYQACRFPHMPHVQELIVAQTSPMTAKMRSKPYRAQSRSDWDRVRVPIMKWCLRVKLVQNWDKFGNLLIQTGDRQIVEDSSKDDFWGAKRDDEGNLRGRNVLGRLLMELREKLLAEPELLETVLPVPLSDFTLFSQPISTIARPQSQAAPTPVGQDLTPQLDLLTPSDYDLDASVQQPTRIPVNDMPPTMEADPASSGPAVAGIRRGKVVWVAVAAILALLAIIAWFVIVRL